MKEKIATYCAQCISRCGCLATVENGVLKSVNKLPNHPTGEGLCMKGRAAPEIVYHPDRILTPLRRTAPKGASDPGWKEISWHEALAEIGSKLNAIKADSGAESVCWGITTPSATAIADSFSWINRLAHAFGSPNKLFATENCNWHKDFSHAYTHGQGIGMPDYEKSDCIILWGFNPEVTWPAQAALVKQAQKRGARLVVIDPRKAGLARKADLWLGVKPGTDGVLAMVLANQLIQSNSFDKKFIVEWSNGPLLVKENGCLLTEADLNPQAATGSTRYVAINQLNQKPLYYDPVSKCFESDEEPVLEASLNLNGIQCQTAFTHYALECQKYTLEVAEKITGVSAEQIQALALLLSEQIQQGNAVSYFGWTGTAQHQHATQMTRAIATLYGLTGSIDKPGGNVYFTKPAVANMLGFELLPEGQSRKTLGAEKSLGPAQKGWINSIDFYQSVVHQQPYKSRALVAFGGSPIATKPNEQMVRDTLKALEFYVHADLFINESANYADIILPVCTSWERAGLYPGFQISQHAESRVQLRQPVIAPQGEAKADTWIVFELAKQLGCAEHFFGGDPVKGLEAVIAPTGLTLEELKANPEGVQLNLTTQYQKYRKSGFATPTGKYEIYSEQFLLAGYAPIPEFALSEEEQEYPYILTSAKVPAYCHSQHQKIVVLSRQKQYPQIEINSELAKGLDINEGDLFSVETELGQMRGEAKLNRDLSRSVLSAQYGWQQHLYNYNGVASEIDSDEISGSNRLKSQRCRIR